MLWMEASAATCIFVSSVGWETVCPLTLKSRCPNLFFHPLFSISSMSSKVDRCFVFDNYFHLFFFFFKEGGGGGGGLGGVGLCCWHVCLCSHDIVFLCSMLIWELGPSWLVGWYYSIYFMRIFWVVKRQPSPQSRVIIWVYINGKSMQTYF